MSASRTRFLSSKAKKVEFSDEEEYDSEEERYRWKQQRLLKKVEESASAIRAVNEITRPFVTGTWRLEREEQRIAAAATMACTPSKENKAHSTSSNASESWNERNDGTDKADSSRSSRRKSIWSPIKHVKVIDQTVLEGEKAWRPLRKSKARQSLAQSLALFNAENACDSADEDATTGCKPLPDKNPSEKTPVLKGAEEVRTPLRDVVGLNHAVGRRKSVSFSNDVTPATPSASVDISNEPSKLESIVRADSDLSTSTPPRSSSMDDSEVGTPLSQTPTFIKRIRSPVRCSSILLQAYGEEYADVRGSIVSPDKVVNLNECSSPKDASKVLKGVTAYVEVRRGEDDRTGGFRWKLKQLGANISDTLNKKVTHVVFQEGLLSTFRKAKQIGAHLVSTLWVMACDESFSKIEEARYPIEKLQQYEFADPLQKAIKRPKIMSPDLGSGRDEKLLTKRLQRRSVRVDSPLSKSNFLSKIKTPSPLKRINFSTNPSPSPLKPLNEDSVDDYDGFLAMVEAQVREKAESKRKTGEMNGTEEDFETRLQRILGQDKDKDPQKPPLASIFQKGKVVTHVATRSSPKKTKEAKKPKQTFDSSSRNSVMSWLQSRSPVKGPGFGSYDSSSAAIAASAAADEILKSMFQSVGQKGKPAATTVPKESDKPVQSMTTTPKTTAKAPRPIVRPKEPFVLSGKSVSATSQPQKKPLKKNKFEFQGSTACSGVMRNWLSGAKSPTQPTQQQQMKPGVSLDVSQKRKTVDLTCASSENSYKAIKKLRGEVTPVKQVPKDAALSSDKKRSVELTPRRRSMRLTPIKATSLQSSASQLEPLHESEVSSFDRPTTITPRKLTTKPSSRATPNKQSHGSVSKKAATPRK